MKSSYKPEDVTILLRDITGLVEPLDNATRERYIQQGVHYSEMLPKELLPTPAYLETFRYGLERFALPTAKATELTAEKILAQKGEQAVLVSLARAGTPVGILLKHYILRKYGISVPHYTISIIRGKGIDRNAMDYILERHAPETIQFVDGWTGKGAIQNQLLEAMVDYPAVDPLVAVLSDPACVAGICGTHTDFMIPSSCLNATVSGLISRTFWREDLIGAEDFHGAMCYAEFADHDLTYHFLETVERHFGAAYVFPEGHPDRAGAAEEVSRIQKEFGVSTVNFVKPSIGEATRVLLRRIPWKILVSSLDDSEYLGHIYQLAREKGIEPELYPLKHYRACGLIRNMADT